MTRELPLTKGKTALVDDDVFDLVNSVSWQAVRGPRNRTWYASHGFRLKGKNKNIWLHHVVAGYPLHGNETDHIDGDSLNNIRSNLRTVSQRSNACNNVRRRQNRTSSKFPGVSFHKASGKWVANIQINKILKYLGLYVREADAAIAYNTARQKLEDSWKPSIV